MTTKQKYTDALERMEQSYYNFDNCISAMNKFKEDINLLEGLVNEHFEEKQETNYEHYKDEIIEKCSLSLALVDGKLHKCSDVYCCDCGFSTGYGCREKIKEWLKSPHKNQTYKLSQFEYDLLNAYKDSGMRKFVSYYRALLELHEKGYFKEIDTSIPIHEILDNCEVIEK